MTKLIAIAVVLALSVVSALGDYFLKLSTTGKSWIEPRWLILGVLTCLSTIFGWCYAMKHLTLTTIAVYDSVLSVLLLSALGVVVFKERLSVSEILGVAASIVALVLLGRSQ